MTLAELKRHGKSHNSEFKERWQRAAWMVMHQLAPYVEKGKRLTIESLLPPELLDGKKGNRINTKEEWEEHKEKMNKVAKWHGSVLRRTLSGAMKSREVGGGELIARHSRKI